MRNIILMTKLKNAMLKTGMDLSFELRNININGDKRGCSGFIVNNDNGTIVYVNTESCLDRYMYRYADSVKDFRGYSNRWANGLDELVEGVAGLLKKSPAEMNDRRI